MSSVVPIPESLIAQTCSGNCWCSMPPRVRSRCGLLACVCTVECLPTGLESRKAPRAPIFPLVALRPAMVMS